jgi:chorismate mutase
MPIRGVRGAITVTEDDVDLILQATRELLEAIVKENADMKQEDIGSAIFTVTDDLAATFPA